MKQLPKTWNPITIENLSIELKGFNDWVLCGGYSIELITGKTIRKHGDVDIGVFRSQVEECLIALGADRVYLSINKTHKKWDGYKIPKEVHDIWVTDKNHKNWVLQIMVFDDVQDKVIYRRNSKIKWSKKYHSIDVGKFKVLNPNITFLFKANKPQIEEKDIRDIIILIENGVEQVAQPDGIPAG